MLPQAARSHTGKCLIIDYNDVEKVWVHCGGEFPDRWYRCADVTSVDGPSAASAAPLAPRRGRKRKVFDVATGTTTDPVPTVRARSAPTGQSKPMNTRQDSKRKAADRAKGTTGGQIGRELVRCFGPIAPSPLGLHAC